MFILGLVEPVRVQPGALFLFGLHPGGIVVRHGLPLIHWPAAGISPRTALASKRCRPVAREGEAVGLVVDVDLIRHRQAVRIVERCRSAVPRSPHRARPPSPGTRGPSRSRAPGPLAPSRGLALGDMLRARPFHVPSRNRDPQQRRAGPLAAHRAVADAEVRARQPCLEPHRAAEAPARHAQGSWLHPPHRKRGRQRVAIVQRLVRQEPVFARKDELHRDCRRSAATGRRPDRSRPARQRTAASRGAHTRSRATGAGRCPSRSYSVKSTSVCCSVIPSITTVLPGQPVIALGPAARAVVLGQAEIPGVDPVRQISSREAGGIGGRRVQRLLDRDR